jgi:hypothetical protein
MVLLLQIGDHVIPDQTPELFLSSSRGPVSSLPLCALALCAMTRNAQGGQEGLGKADQMQVCNCRPIRAVLVVAEP